MEHIYHIRYEHNEKGKSIRQIARETGHDRETVKRHIDQEDFCMPMRVKKKRRSITDAYRDQVIEWLLGDEKAPSACADGLYLCADGIACPSLAGYTCQ